MFFQASFPKTSIHFGIGKIADLTKVYNFSGKKVLIVCGKKFAKETGLISRILEYLSESNPLEVRVFEGVGTNPSVDYVYRIFVDYRDVDVVVGVGGGSVLDVAKAGALAIANKKQNIWDYIDGKDSPKVPSIPMIAIPTTAGTGSEVNKNSVLINPERNEKRALSHQFMYPKTALLDPSLTISLPFDITVYSAIDALSHAIEGYFSITGNDIANIFAKEAIKIILKSLETLGDAKNRGEEGKLLGDHKFREELMFGALLAGIVLDMNGTTLLHAVEHPLSARHPQIHHGKGMLPFLKPYFSINKHYISQKLEKLNKYLGKDIEAWIETVLQKLGMNIRLRDLGIKEEEIGEIANDAFRYMVRSLERNPKKLNIEELKKFLESVY